MDLNRYSFIEFLNKQNIDIGLAWWIDFIATSSLLLLISYLLAAVSRTVSKNILIKLSKQTKTHLEGEEQSSWCSSSCPPLRTSGDLAIAAHAADAELD